MAGSGSRKEALGMPPRREFIASLRQQVAAGLAVARRGAGIAASIWSATAVEGATLTLRQSPWHAAILGYMYEASVPTNTTTAAAARTTTKTKPEKTDTREQQQQRRKKDTHNNKTRRKWTQRSK